MIEFDKTICSNPAPASQREWLETNDIGGFATSTLVGMNTRRYHGLLVASLHPPVDRFVLLSKLEETLTLDGARIDLSCNQYPGAIHPQGYQFLARFEKLFFPVFVYRVGVWEVRKTVFLVHGENTVGIEYHFSGPAETKAQFDVRPLLAYRDYHSLTHENDALSREIEIGEGRVTFSPYFGLPPLIVHHTGGSFSRDGFWYKSFQYAREQERGLDFAEDLFSPGYFRADVEHGSQLCLLATVEGAASEKGALNGPRFREIKESELGRRQNLVKGLRSKDAARHHLRLAADQFLVRRGEDQRSVIAGYPWFTDWGRDTMIALPGLLLATENYGAVRDILRTFVQSMKDGLIPNRFPDRPESGETPDYNTADATLWFFHLAYELARRNADHDFVKQYLYEAMVDSFEWHRRGTQFNIRMSDDGLLSAGREGVQLTWMDARVGDWVVTPRHGKAVEICALWFNALRVLEHFAAKFGDKSRAKELSFLALKAKESFNDLFWNPATHYLNDVVNDQGVDASLRPNQLLALALAFTPLPASHQRPVVAAVTQHLLTPFGLRTLSPEDSHYRASYRGNQYERDSAYHQGTVWPWLMGPYCTAYLNAHGRTAKNKSHVRNLLRPLLDYLLQEGVGQIPEIFDGDVEQDPDATPRPLGKGCFAQAWSVAEIHRILVEET